MRDNRAERKLPFKSRSIFRTTMTQLPTCEDGIVVPVPFFICVSLMAVAWPRETTIIPRELNKFAVTMLITMQARPLIHNAVAETAVVAPTAGRKIDLVDGRRRVARRRKL